MTYQKYSTFCIDIFEKGYCFEIRHTLRRHGRHDRHLVNNSGSARAWVRAETLHEFEQNIRKIRQVVLWDFDKHSKKKVYLSNHDGV